MAGKIFIPLQPVISCFLEPAVNRRVAVGAAEGFWSSYSPVCPEGPTLLCTLVAVAQVNGGSSVLNLLGATDQANETCEHRPGI